MNEFMLFIRKQNEVNEALPFELHQKFLKACEQYIKDLKESGNLISARPMEKTGKLIVRKANVWEEFELDATEEITGGYYHILAKNLDEAITIAKRNPEFEFYTNAKIEVSPVKIKEEHTGFTYPGNKLQ